MDDSKIKRKVGDYLVFDVYDNQSVKRFIINIEKQGKSARCIMEESMGNAEKVSIHYVDAGGNPERAIDIGDCDILGKIDAIAVGKRDFEAYSLDV